MPTSQRIVDVKTLQNTKWYSIFQSEKKRSSLVFRDNYCFEIVLTHRDLRPMPSVDPDAQERTWDSDPLIPHYFDGDVMKQGLKQLSDDLPASMLIPFTTTGGVCDSIAARVPVANEWLQLFLLPIDWMFGRQRELEIQWLSGQEKRIKNRYRRSDACTNLAGQMPADYWGTCRLLSHEVLWAVSHPFSVQVVFCHAEAHVQDEQGVGSSYGSGRAFIVGQLANGVVLWWRSLNAGTSSHQVSQQGEYVVVGDKRIHIFTGAVSPSL